MQIPIFGLWMEDTIIFNSYVSVPEGIICIYTRNPNDLYSWRDPAPQNKAEIPIKTLEPRKKTTFITFHWILVGL